ncbi:hypothetical protein CERSUDRAFT_27699, partial [Gelatoporia subvermispora B]
RMGELIWPNDKSLRDWRKLVKRGSIVLELTRISYHLPYHKGDRFFRGTTILQLQQSVACPVALLHEYITHRDARHGALTPLFLCHSGVVPTRSWFEHRFFSALSHDYGGHSARAGGATYYA